MSATFIARDGRCDRVYEERAPEEPKDGISPNLSAKFSDRSSSSPALPSTEGRRFTRSSRSRRSCAVLHTLQHHPTEIAPTRAPSVAADGLPAAGTPPRSDLSWQCKTREAAIAREATRACSVPGVSAAVMAT